MYISKSKSIRNPAILLAPRNVYIFNDMSSHWHGNLYTDSPINPAIHKTFHTELKRKLRDGVDHYAIEKHRLPLSEIKKIKKKKIREFYEAQNDRLNDWLEVDALVMSMAEDVLDSMNPIDTDGDGVAEEGGKLMITRGDIWELLPQDERERRNKGERRAKWAINVCANVFPVKSKSISSIPLLFQSRYCSNHKFSHVRRIWLN